MQKQKEVKSQYGLIAVCTDEKNQQALYAKLRAVLPGVKIKVVCV